MRAWPATRDVIVFAASTGGVKALRALVGALPADLQAAVLVILHISLHRRSPLAEILDRAGPLPAQPARHGDLIEIGHLYVAPPDRHLIVEDGHLRLYYGPRENQLRPAIAVLFRSAAQAYGRRVEDQHQIDHIGGQMQQFRSDPLRLWHGAMGASQQLRLNDLCDTGAVGGQPVRFQMDTLKIDRKVIEHVAHRRQDRAMAAAVIILVNDLNVRVVAEGVETMEQLAFLLEKGCRAAQGFLFSPPVAARSLEVLLRAGHWSRMNPGQEAE